MNSNILIIIKFDYYKKELHGVILDRVNCDVSANFRYRCFIVRVPICYRRFVAWKKSLEFIKKSNPFISFFPKVYITYQVYRSPNSAKNIRQQKSAFSNFVSTNTKTILRKERISEQIIFSGRSFLAQIGLQ